MNPNNPFDNPHEYKSQGGANIPPVINDDDIPTADLAGQSGGQAIAIQRPNSGRGWIWIFLVVLAVIVIFVTVVIFLILQAIKQLAPHVAQPELEETYDEKYAYVASAFAGNESMDPEKRRLAQSFLNRLTGLANKANESFDASFELAELVDFDRLEIQVRRMRPNNDLDNAGFDSFDIRSTYSPIVEWSSANNLKCISSKLFAIRELGDGSEWILYFDVLEDDGGREKLRMWVTIEDDVLYMYDIEQLNNEVRLSEDIGADYYSEQLSFSFDKRLRYEQNREDLFDANRLINVDQSTEDIESGDQLLQNVDVDLLDGPDKKYYYSNRLLADWMLDNCSRMIDETTDEFIYPFDSPLGSLYEGIARLELQQFDKAMTAFERYENLLGPDALAQSWIGHCHIADGDNEKAAMAFGNALKLNREDKNALGELAALKLESDPELIKGHFIKTVDHSSAFREIAAKLNSKGRFDLVEKMLDIYRPLKSNDFFFDWYQAIAFQLDDKNQQAADLLSPWLKHRNTNDEMKNYDVLALYVRNAIRVYPIEKIYNTAGQDFAAIEKIADEFSYDAEQLEKLADFCQGQQFDSYFELYYRARSFWLVPEHQKAYTLIQSNLEKVNSYPDRQRFFDILYPAAVEAGHTVEAYKNATRKKQAFESMMYYMVDNKKLDQMPSLIEVARKHISDDDDFVYAEAFLKFNASEFDQSYQLLAPVMRSKPKKDRKPRLNQLYVNCAIKIKKLNEAYQSTYDKRSFFDYLMYVELNEANLDMIAEVAESFLANFNDKEKYLYTKTRIACFKKDWSQANKFWTEYKSVSKYPTGMDYLIAEAAYNSKQPNELLAEFKYDQALLKYLGNWHLYDRNSKLMRSIIGHWKTNHPDIEIPELWEVGADVFDKNYDSALPVLLEINNGKRNDKYTYNYRYWSLLIECYLGLDRKDPAFKTADELADNLDSVFALSAALYFGDKERAKQKLAAVFEQDYYTVEEISESAVFRFVMQKESAKKMFDELNAEYQSDELP